MNEGRDAASAFFATLALRLTPEVDWSCGTMATAGRSLAYDPGFVCGLSSDEAPGFTLPPSRIVPGEDRYAHLPAGKSADVYYDLLADRSRSDSPDDPGKSSDGGSEESDDPGGCGGVKNPKGDLPSDAEQVAAEWQVAVAQAEQAAKGRGQLPAGLARTVDDVVRPAADWRAVLRAFVSSHARNDYSWARPNRRFIAHGLYLRGLRSQELGDVALAVDTSGSVGPAELAAFAAEADAILSSFDCTAAVAYHGAAVQKVESWQSTDGPLVLTPVGGGGTSHVCVFDRLAASGLSPACAVCPTDLDTEFPTAPPDVPVLWAVVGGNNSQPPFGRRVTLAP